VDYTLSARVPAGLAPSYPDLARRVREDEGRSLSDPDILALVLSPGRNRLAVRAARRVLGGGSLRALAACGHETPRWWADLPEPAAVRLAAALELARRLETPGADARPFVGTPRDVFDATGDIRHSRREHFVGLYLNTRNRLLARETVSLGSLNASIVHPREVFEPAVRLGAANLVVVHNHPSGETDPSEDDLGITRRLRAAGEILGISLLDHVIVGSRGYTSLKEGGHL
jgi:DNA repair protein RadC